MAAPNVFNSANCTLTNSFLAATTSPTSLVSNAAASNTVVRVISVYISNNANATSTLIADVYNGTAVQANVAYGVSVPVGSSLVLLAKDSPLHLIEGQSLRLTASANATLQGTASYEVIS